MLKKSSTSIQGPDGFVLEDDASLAVGCVTDLCQELDLNGPELYGRCRQRRQRQYERQEFQREQHTPMCTAW